MKKIIFLSMLLLGLSLNIFTAEISGTARIIILSGNYTNFTVILATDRDSACYEFEDKMLEFEVSVPQSGKISVVKEGYNVKSFNDVVIDQPNKTYVFEVNDLVAKNSFINKKTSNVRSHDHTSSALFWSGWASYNAATLIAFIAGTFSTYGYGAIIFGPAHLLGAIPYAGPIVVPAALWIAWIASAPFIGSMCIITLTIPLAYSLCSIPGIILQFMSLKYRNKHAKSKNTEHFSMNVSPAFDKNMNPGLLANATIRF
jgi:hypothetical protein